MAGIFVLLALPVTVYEVAMHLEYLSRPKLQIRVIRILWMVPIYAVDRCGTGFDVIPALVIILPLKQRLS